MGSALSARPPGCSDSASGMALGTALELSLAALTTKRHAAWVSALNSAEKPLVTFRKTTLAYGLRSVWWTPRYGF